MLFVLRAQPLGDVVAALSRLLVGFVADVVIGLIEELLVTIDDGDDDDPAVLGLRPLVGQVNDVGGPGLLAVARGREGGDDERRRVAVPGEGRQARRSACWTAFSITTWLRINARCVET